MPIQQNYMTEYTIYMNRLFIAIAIGVTFISAPFTYGQFLPEPVSLIATPTSPSPGETVSIQAATPTFDKDTAVFNWTINGSPQPTLSGIGKNVATRTAGDVGSTIRASVRIIKNTGETAEASLVVYVEDLALPWFAETYRPPWYRGKALPTQGSVVTIVAMPHVIINGARISAENLLYQWSLDDEDNALSGLGKKTFRVKTKDFRKESQEIRVTVEDIDHTIVKTGRIFIAPISPLTMLYAVSPLGGPETRNARTIFDATKRGLIDFIAEPFFFTTTLRNVLSYQWRINGTPLSGSAENPSLITIDTTNQPAKSEATLSVQTSEANPLRPRAARSITLIFP